MKIHDNILLSVTREVLRASWFFAIFLPCALLFCAVLVGNAPKAFALSSWGGAIILTGPELHFFLDSTDTNFARSGTLSPGSYTFTYQVLLQSNDTQESLSTASQQFSFILGGPAGASQIQRTLVADDGTGNASQETSSTVGAFSRSAADSSLSGSGVAGQTSNVDGLSLESSSAVFINGKGVASSTGFWTFTINTPTSYSMSGSQQFSLGSVTSDPPGSAPTNPVLPTSPSFSPSCCWIFNSGTGQWVDPPLAAGFRYVMQSSSLFTSILDFPSGFVSPFTVSTGGTILGQFGPGQSVDFTQFGGGVTEFTVSGISPLADAANPVAFPLKLAFNTPTATFEMQPVPNNDNEPPIANAGANQTVNEASLVTLNGTASLDPNNDPLDFTWSQISGPNVSLSATDVSMPTFTAPPVGPQGAMLKFQLVVNDDLHDSAASEVTVTVQNLNDPPRCDLAQPSLSSLWPPNHNLVLVNLLGVSDPNNDQVAITITGVTQDEPVNDLGDGDTSPDAVTEGSAILLRAERSAKGNGRVYKVNFKANDGQGAVCYGSINVGVPLNMETGNSAIDSGQLYDSTQP